jgi:hypothetical protein
VRFEVVELEIGIPASRKLAEPKAVARVHAKLPDLAGCCQSPF